LLVRHLANTLQCDCSVIGVLAEGQPNHMQTLAFFADRHWLPNILYDTTDTPCASVLQGASQIHAAGLRERFPHDAWIKQWGIESYAGTPLFDSLGQVIGIISVLARRPLSDPDAVRSALQIYAARAAAELERLQTEQSLRRSQAALAESEERFRQMAETIRDLFWLYDVREGRMLYMSPAYEALSGRSREWILEDPHRWIETVHEDDRASVAAMPKPTRPGLIFDGVYRVVWPDGSIRWIHDRRYAIFEGGECVRLAGVCEDVSDRQQAVERLEQQAAQVAHLARVTTVGELVASIAHEINQPLYAISNFSAALRVALEKGNAPLSQLREWNEEISRAVARAGDIIRRVRSYITRGPLVRKPSRLPAIVEESAALLQAEARRQRITLHLEIPPDLPMLSIDPLAIQQVLVNLLHNAFEASADTAGHERKVVVEARHTDSELEVLVRDAGVGLTDEDLEHLFQPFYTTKVEGMGLGLPISKTIVEAHGGRIWAESRLGEGSVFTFELPVAPATTA
jgi:PAS domain S-box-containing protein